MFGLFDIYEERGLQKGISQGIAKGADLKLFELVSKGLIALDAAVENSGLSRDIFLEKMNRAGFQLPVKK